jgi:NADH-quinone oxidoreductase subunit M
MIAYTSVNHMGYVLLGLGAAGLAADADLQARTVATVGAVYQMVSHGLLTGALFLLSGVLWSRGHTYAFDRWGGLARPAPLFAALFAVAAFGSLGLPGFASFIAEFQVFTGALEAAPVATVVAVLGILVTAGLFLVAVQRLLTGSTLVPQDAPAETAADTAEAVAAPAGSGDKGRPIVRTTTPTRSDDTARMADVRGPELASIVPLLVLAVVLGLFPRVLLDVVEPASAVVAGLVSR